MKWYWRAYYNIRYWVLDKIGERYGYRAPDGDLKEIGWKVKFLGRVYYIIYERYES
jgi:hypothetical protein